MALRNDCIFDLEAEVRVELDAAFDASDMGESDE
jgi:hypothetical protein